MPRSNDAYAHMREGDLPGDRGELEASADPYAGGEARDLPIWTPDQIAAHLNRSGFSWDVSKDKVITYGFYDGPTTTGIYNNPHEAAETYGYSPFNEAQRAAAREAMRMWDDVVAVKFQEDSKGHGNWDISFANTTTGPGQAWAYLPHGTYYGSKYQHIQGDIWVNPAQPSNMQLDPGFYGLTTLIHEAGHAIGLSHPGDYNASDDVELSYALADYFQDSRQYSIMSYWDAYETGGQHIDWNLMRFSYASTPMVHDIYAAQKMYGADMTTRTGNTVYGFNSNTGIDAFTFEANEIAPVIAIWDAGGNDTLDLSGYDTPSIIDLNPGAYSSAGGTVEFLSLEEINANNAAAGLPDRSAFLYEVYMNGVAGTNGGESWREISNSETGLMKDNIGIAYGATIENAVGGGGDDSILGNSVGNRLSGGGGDDTIEGGAGNDTLEGGAGADTFVFRTAEKGDQIVAFDADDVIDLAAIDANSTAAGDQAFTFVAGNFTGAGQLRVANGQVEGDLNGDGTADLIIKLVGGGIAPTGADFVL